MIILIYTNIDNNKMNVIKVLIFFLFKFTIKVIVKYHYLLIYDISLIFRHNQIVKISIIKVVNYNI